MKAPVGVTSHGSWGAQRHDPQRVRSFILFAAVMSFHFLLFPTKPTTNGHSHMVNEGSGEVEQKRQDRQDLVIGYKRNRIGLETSCNAMVSIASGLSPRLKPTLSTTSEPLLHPSGHGQSELCRLTPHASTDCRSTASVSLAPAVDGSWLSLVGAKKSPR